MASCDYSGEVFSNNDRKPSSQGLYASAVLGDGNVKVCLHKHSSFSVHSDGVELFRGYSKSWADQTEHLAFQYGEYNIEIAFTYEDNYYIYAKLEQPDGTIFYGYSGYGVGEGFEDGSYGHSNEDRVCTLNNLFGVEF